MATQKQDDFVRLFRAYAASDRAYQPLADFVKSLPIRDLRDCLASYFDVSKDYRSGGERQRSITVFYDLSLRGASLNVYFALSFEALVQVPSSDWRDRYVALEKRRQGLINREIDKVKRDLSVTQRAFLQEFVLYMDQRTKTAITRLTNWVLKIKKSDSLFDCLRVYVEVSQKYPDNDKESLAVFSGLSENALYFGDATFAAQYEALITSTGTIWKRRYDALDPTLRSGKLDPLIREKKKITTEVKGTSKGKEVKATERHTVPKFSAAPRDPEERRVNAPLNPIQREFTDLFTNFMQDPRVEPKAVTDYVFGLARRPEKAKLLGDCLEAYLQASTGYKDNERRSLYIFVGVAALAIANNDSYYALKFDARRKIPGSVVAKRNDALQVNDRKVLQAEIDKKAEQQRLIDELKFAYFRQESRDPTLDALRTYEFVYAPDVFHEFSGAVDAVNRSYGLLDADGLANAFDVLAALLKGQQDVLLVATLLKKNRQLTVLASYVRHELSWYLVGILYIRALVAHPNAYLNGLNDEEKKLLFDSADFTDPYFNDFALRYEYLWTHRGAPEAFAVQTKAHLVMTIIAAKIGARLLTAVEGAQVRGLVEKLRKEKPEALNVRIPMNSRWARQETLTIGQTIGKAYILWWSENTGTFIEYEGYEGVTFGVDYDWLGRAYDTDVTWGEIYRQTKWLEAAIPLLFQLLGYLPDLVSGGVTGLAKAIFVNIAMEHATQALGLDPNLVQLALLGAGAIIHGVATPKEPHAVGMAGSTEGRLIEPNGARNRLVESHGTEHGEGQTSIPDPSGIGNPGTHERLRDSSLTEQGERRPTDPDPRGVETEQQELMIRGEGTDPVESVPPRATSRPVTSSRAIDTPDRWSEVYGPSEGWLNRDEYSIRGKIRLVKTDRGPRALWRPDYMPDEFQDAHPWPLNWGGPEATTGRTFAHRRFNAGIQKRVENAGRRLAEDAEEIGMGIRATVAVERYPQGNLAKSATYRFEAVTSTYEVHPLGEVTIEQNLSFEQRRAIIEGSPIPQPPGSRLFQYRFQGRIVTLDPDKFVIIPGDSAFAALDSRLADLMSGLQRRSR